MPRKTKEDRQIPQFHEVPEVNAEIVQLLSPFQKDLKIHQQQLVRERFANFQEGLTRLKVALLKRPESKSSEKPFNEFAGFVVTLVAALKVGKLPADFAEDLPNVQVNAVVVQESYLRELASFEPVQLLLEELALAMIKSLGPLKPDHRQRFLEDFFTYIFSDRKLLNRLASLSLSELEDSLTSKKKNGGPKQLLVADFLTTEEVCDFLNTVAENYPKNKARQIDTTFKGIKRAQLAQWLGMLRVTMAPIQAAQLSRLIYQEFLVVTSQALDFSPVEKWIEVNAQKAQPLLADKLDLLQQVEDVEVLRDIAKEAESLLQLKIGDEFDHQEIVAVIALIRAKLQPIVNAFYTLKELAKNRMNPGPVNVGSLLNSARDPQRITVESFLDQLHLLVQASPRTMKAAWQELMQIAQNMNRISLNFQLEGYLTGDEILEHQRVRALLSPAGIQALPELPLLEVQVNQYAVEAEKVTPEVARLAAIAYLESLATSRLINGSDEQPSQQDKDTNQRLSAEE